MIKSRLLLGFLGSTTALFFAACSGGSGSGDGGSVQMGVQIASNGFGNLLPYSVVRLGSNPVEIIPIIDRATLIDNVVPGNPVLPPPQFPEETILPSGEQGSHFVYVRFTKALDIDSVMDASPGAQANFALAGTVTLTAVSPQTGASSPIPVRVFLNGKTYAGTPVIDPDTGSSIVPLQEWVRLDENGKPQACVDGDGNPVSCTTEGAVPLSDNDGDGIADGFGFPGTQGAFNGMSDLIDDRTMVFVMDVDGNLSTHETFPPGVSIRLRVTTAAMSTNAEGVASPAMAMTTVGDDTLQPEVASTPPPTQLPIISPGQGDIDVDPMTDIQIAFTEPVQPLTVGSLPTGNPPLLSAALRVEFGPSTSRVVVPFTAEPISVFDLSVFKIQPSFNFPGEGPAELQCGIFNRIDVTANPDQIADLAGNTNVLGAQTFFLTGEGAGIVNVPILPDAIYVGRGGAVPGLSVIDLNGFGAGTGNPTYDPQNPITEGNSNYPNNPNVKLQGAFVIPPLQPGTCTLNGGSAGVFTLAKDSALNDLVSRSPLLTSVGDMMIGHALDGTFNNGPFPFGCQAAGGNLCAFDGKKIVNAVQNVDSMNPIQLGQFGTVGAGAENFSCWAPHPNPPPLVFPPLCVSPYLGAQEPSSVDTIGTPLVPTGVTNLLLPGNNSLGNPTIGIPPSTLITPEQNAFFQGPSRPMPGAPVSACSDYMIRQQVGNYLYVIDRGRSQVLVLNSNRMTIIDRISTPDPTQLAMSPNVDLLAVSNQTADLVSFVDINPNSATFHQIVQSTPVGRRPRGIAWEPGNEDILVCNESDSSLSLISALSLQERRVVSTNLDRPFDLAVTPRQLALGGFGFLRNVYFAWVLNRNGRVALFESGPSGVNGWGFDDIIGVSSETFINPKTVQPDYLNLNSGCWIVHEGPINTFTGQEGPAGVGALSNLVILSGVAGQLPLNNLNFFVNPNIRDMQTGVFASIGEGTFGLSGVPVDLAFDNQRHLAGLPNVFGAFSAGAPVPFNGKGFVRPIPGGVRRTTTPQFIFVAVPNPNQGTGVVDVFNLTGALTRQDTNSFMQGTQSIPVPNVAILMDYFRQ